MSEPTAEEPRTGERLRLFALSFLMLFVELALIRWIGSNIFYLSYFSNFVLLGSFLGIGIGFLRATKQRNLFQWAPLALALLVGFVLKFPVEIDRSGSELIYFGTFERSGLPVWITLPVLFLVVAAVMATIAEGVGRVFGKFRPLDAYRLDILGSIAGIGAFAFLSVLQVPPVGWGAVAAVVFAALFGRRIRPTQGVALAAIVIMLATESASRATSWSPYYKIQVAPRQERTGDVLDIKVNGVPHQVIVPVERRALHEPLYFIPYRRTTVNPMSALVIGSGAGADVAVGLYQGLSRIDAVEIDPRIYEIGTQLNPDRPYDDPRVQAFIEDGRAFMQRIKRRYDLVVFALTDSVTLVAGQSSLRLESYLFTLEAMRKAKERLNPDGVFVMYNYFREPWLIDRLGRMLTQTFGHPPCLDSFPGGRLAVLATSTDTSAVSCERVWEAGGFAPEPVTDDYPFVYLKSRSIPSPYLVTIALILLASIVAVRTATGAFKFIGTYLDLLLMGAAFLLLETKSVVQFALLFGTTWIVNALVFAGILLAVLAAIEVANRFAPKTPTALYALLGASLFLAWLIPLHAYLSVSAVPRFFLATAVTFAPIFLANLIFAERFKRVASSQVAFGTNLLGAMIGGVLEYGSLIIGYRALLLIVAVLYGVAFLTRPRVTAHV